MSNDAWTELWGLTGEESAEQFARLRNLAQGTYSYKPLPADVATTLLDAEIGKPNT